jgi:thiol:disulfide interchange protein DsbA
MQRILMAICLLVFGVLAFAQSKSTNMDVQSAQFKEGKDYIVLPESYSQDVTAQASLQSHPENNVEVLAFFNYGCPVCYRMEPAIEEWHRQQEQIQIVSFVDVPVDWNHQGWENLARAYFIAEALDVTDTAHPRLFRAVHQQGKRFCTKEQLEEFFIAETGVSRAQFEETYDSFHVRRRMKQAELMREAYKVRSIPTFIVAGKYMVDVQTAGSPEQVVEVINYLVNKESFTEGVEEIRFDEVTEGIDHTQDDAHQLGDEQKQDTMTPSAAPR